MQSLTITPGAGQTPFQQSFTYDELNRLKSATETQSGGQTWKQTYGYDRYGNRWFDAANTTATVLGPLTSASDFNASNNRIVKSGYSYDQAGNLTAEPSKSYVYDAENRLTSATASGVTTSYIYDGEGRRVRKNAGGVITRMIYNHLGQLVAEYNDSGSLIKEYVYKGSELLASYDASRGAEYATGDHLGSPRIWTNSSGQVITGGRHDYLPFGEELFAGVANRTTVLNYPSTSQADGKRQQFTSKERDNESGLDYFLARYYSSAQGRFTSADPLFLELRRLGDPQQLNLYAYTRGNPLKFIDPLGLDITVTGSEQEEYRKRLQANLSFQVSLNKQNKVVIVDANGKELDKKALKALEKTLKGGEKELFKAITNTKNHVTIDTVRRDANVDFGRFDGGGKNTVDIADLELLDAPKNAGGLSSAQVVGHETLEAYASSKGKNIADSHNFANTFFGGLGAPDPTTLQVYGIPGAGTILRASAEWPVHGKTGVREKITREFLTPIPINAIPRGHTPAHIVDVEKKP